MIINGYKLAISEEKLDDMITLALESIIKN